MKLIFMGTPDFAVATLDALVKAGHEVALVVTQPDRPKGRSHELQKSDVKIAAEKYGIDVITPERIRKDEEAKTKMRALHPDVIVVTAFGQILPEDILEIPKYGCINVHASLLPKYRGAAPIQWAVLNGEKESGVTTMMMDKGLDTGDILEVSRVQLAPKETGGSLFEKLAVEGGKLIVKTLTDLEAGTLTRTRQDDTQATKVGIFHKSSGLINWNDPALKIERMIRGLNPWPSAFTYLAGKQLKLWDADVLDDHSISHDGYRMVACVDEDKIRMTAEKSLPDPEDYRLKDQHGTIWTDGKTLRIMTGAGVLSINELQLEGKKRMTCAEFLRGHRFS
ncbi:methionyl-tRNA formyltransferase [Oribacterium sp. HCP28S3_H8]|uniref:methionyl-tRNA formyltransferase n=1 Tax=Oribacterium sp. HCP28S3_H8 TaxID=3438945 RepID=UPI003F8AB440